MLDYPKTLVDVKLHRYREWAGNPSGSVYQPGKCAYEIFSAIPSSQCSRSNGHGPAGLYCKQHSKIVAPSGRKEK